MLKLGIAFLAWLVRLAVVIETRDSEPCSISTGLTCLGVQVMSKGILLGKLGTIALQVVLADTAFIHPQAQALVANELHDTNGFIDSSVLGWCAVHFVL